MHPLLGVWSNFCHHLLLGDAHPFQCPSPTHGCVVAIGGPISKWRDGRYLDRFACCSSRPEGKRRAQFGDTP